MRTPRKAARNTAVIGALTALLSAGLTAPAQAAPVFTQSDSDSRGSIQDTSPVPCTLSNDVASAPQNNVPVVENGPALAVAHVSQGRLTLDSDATDTLDFATNSTTRIKIGSSGGNPTTITMDAKGAAQMTASKGTSACSVSAFTQTDLEATFTVANAGFFLYDYDASRHAYGEIYFEWENGDEIDLWNEISRWKGSGRVSVVPGTHEIFMEADVWARRSTSFARTPVTVNLKATYVKAGALLAAAKGKAEPFVGFPAGRTCATHTVDLKVKKAGKIKSVKFLVNGKTVKKVNGPKNGVVKLPVADGVDAAVTTQVVLKPTRKGAKPKTVSAAASYIACA